MNLALTEQIQLAVRTGLELRAPDYKFSALTARLFLAFAKKKKQKQKQKHAQKQKTKQNTKNKNRKKEHELTNFFTQFKEKLKLISTEIALGVGNLQASVVWLRSNLELKVTPYDIVRFLLIFSGCSERFFSGYSAFLLYPETNISNSNLIQKASPISWGYSEIKGMQGYQLLKLSSVTPSLNNISLVGLVCKVKHCRSTI